MVFAQNTTELQTYIEDVTVNLNTTEWKLHWKKWNKNPPQAGTQHRAD